MPDISFNDSAKKTVELEIRESNKRLGTKVNPVRPAGPSCQTIRLSDKKMPMVALATAAGSGTTWARHLFQQVTGQTTCILKVTDPDVRHVIGRDGHPDQSHVMAIKSGCKSGNSSPGAMFSRACIPAGTRRLPNVGLLLDRRL